jgi:hypothetical protein
MKTTDAIATVRLVDYSPVIHAVTGKWTYCGRDAGGYVQPATGAGAASPRSPARPAYLA